MAIQFKRIISIDTACNGRDMRIWLEGRECPVVIDGWDEAIKEGMIGRVYRGRFEFKAAEL